MTAMITTTTTTTQTGASRTPLAPSTGSPLRLRFMQHTIGAAVRLAVRVGRNLGTTEPITSGPALPRPTASVEVIDDPEGLVRLIGVRGHMNCELIEQIAAAMESAPTNSSGRQVHLDFTAAVIPAERAIIGMERVFEDAERCGVRLRVVGLDPDHPGLTSRTRR